MEAMFKAMMQHMEPETQSAALECSRRLMQCPENTEKLVSMGSIEQLKKLIDFNIRELPSAANVSLSQV